MNTDATVREIRQDDYESLVRFLEENNIAAILRYFHPFPFTPETVQNIIYETRKDKYYIVVLDNKIVGFSMLRGWDEGFSVPSFGIMIDHRFHGRRIGKRLMEDTLKEACKLDCERIKLSVYASNTGAIRLYESMGFYEDSRQQVMVGQEYDEKITMIKELKR